MSTEEDNLELCPRCKIGKMRPTGKVGSDRSIKEPFAETGTARRYQCDNCGHVQFSASMIE